MPVSILETSLYADDLDACEAFYRDILGLEVYGKVEDRHVFFKCDRQMLLIFAAAETVKGSTSRAMPVPAHGARGQGHVCFHATADEIEAWRKKLLANDIAIEADFRWPSGGRSLYFRDPAGNSLEFAEPKIWGLA